MNNNEGISLVELIIIVGIMGLLLTIIFSTTIFSYNSFSIQNEEKNINASTRDTMDYLIRQIRKSNEIQVIDNTLILDGDIYKLEDGSIFQNDLEIIQGIDELYISQKDDVIHIEIIIRDSRNRDHELSCKVNIR
ncbi:MAG: hypothetical protein GX214_03000 [Clostridiales bacterium]|nr:hypothetical protein [Clostridiales bacterium]